jgi:hypothetical protein
MTARAKLRGNHVFRSLAVERLENRSLMAADVVLDWNEIALDAIRAAPIAPPIAARALAIMHAAVYDAVNAIDRTHAVYAVDVLAAPGSSREAAAAAAAHAALVALFPTQEAVFEAALTASLADIPDGLAEDFGVALGENVAHQMLALRAGDGAGATVVYTPTGDPGDWAPTPPANAAALLPHWANVTPFAMTSGNQFRPDGIPALTSAAYATAVNQVKDLGKLDSATRTADQTNIALFWANGANTATPAGHLNVLASIVAEQAGNTLSENARLFAMLNVAMADAAILAWDAKSETDLWRPITAIRNADLDDNAATTADPNWLPLIATPPFPTYVSGHSSFSGAAAAVLEAFFGTDNIAFELPSENASVPDRSFTSFSQAAAESAVSRLYGGIHFSFDNQDGLTAGTALGEFVTDNFFELESQGAEIGLEDGVLIVYGTQRKDNILVSQSRGKIHVHLNGRRVQSFNSSEVEGIAIDARGGNDRVTLAASIRLSAALLGGDGNDTLIGGRGNDMLDGGAGNDILLGMLGNDLLNGDTGNDFLWGGPGRDTLHGGSGRNRLLQ